MSERRWSTRLKAKLLRRSSTSSRNLRLAASTTNTSTSTSHETPPIPSDAQSIIAEKKAEAPADANANADPEFASTARTRTTTPPISTPPPNQPDDSHSHSPSQAHPPTSSASPPSISSLAESHSLSQYTPDELASATGSPGGQYFFVPEYRRPTSTSSAPREEHPVTVTQASPAKTLKGPSSPSQEATPTRRSNHERARSGSSRKSLPAELLTFPLSPRRPDSSAPVSPAAAAKADLPATPLSLTKSDRLITNGTPNLNISPQRHASGAVSVELAAPLHTVAEKSFSTYQSFPIPPSALSTRPALRDRQQSLLPASHSHLVHSLLDTGSISEPDAHGRQRPSSSGMGLRKIWVRRPGGSATLLPTSEDALVDELRDQVVLKYANSLGKTFDAPDIIIRIATREGTTNRLATPDRILSPEEPLWSVVDSFYPGGQTVSEALVIEIPQRRTPKPSPRHNVYLTHSEPGEHGDYFPLMPSSNLNVSTPPQQAHSTASGNNHPAPSISILTTGHAPQLPSPGARPRLRRPPITRHTTHSPTLLGSASSKDAASAVSAQTAPHQPTPPVPTPPVAPAPESPHAKAHTPPARVSSPRPTPIKQKKPSQGPLLNGAFGGLIEGTVPPINVLIVEDNVINQRLLEAFMKRLSVRWKCAANGAEAVSKWREGGFHLVLMDIQLPVMNGLDATKEIRRLERLNGIGVFPKKSGTPSAGTGSGAGAGGDATPPDPISPREEDSLHDLSLFKSPVIIVALTASSLQSDRHEALAAGCNDFLTKPVRFEWLEQKVTEWGCMQALIDFEGWRKWRGYASSQSDSSSGRSSPESRNGTNKTSPVVSPSPSAKRLDEATVNGTGEKGKGINGTGGDEAQDAESPGAGSGSGSGGEGTGEDSPSITQVQMDQPSPMQEGNI